MNELGEQWIEEIDGKKHMLKAVAQLSIYDGKSINGRTCHGCSFVDEWDDDCTLKNPPCRISEHKAGPFIIKDLGILNEDGCLPSPWGGYPKIVRVGREGFCTYKVRFYLKHGRVYGFTLIEVTGNTRQEAIDEWNRRSV